MEPIIKIDNLTIKTKNEERLLVENVSLSIPKNSIVGIVGESGSGKSLTIKSLMNILPDNLKTDPYTLTFHQQPIVNSEDLPISMIFQDPMTSLNPLRTIGFHLVEVSQRYQKTTPQEAHVNAVNMLKKVGITQPEIRMKQYPFELSGGMRQRVMMAMALLAQPEILIADEPTTALDVTIQLQILSLLTTLKNEMGLTVILVSHDFGVIAGMCDYIYVMYQGQIVEAGTVEEIFENPQHSYTKKLLALARFDMTKSQIEIEKQGQQLLQLSQTHYVRKEWGKETVSGEKVSEVESNGQKFTEEILVGVEYTGQSFDRGETIQEKNISKEKIVRNSNGGKE